MSDLEGQERAAIEAVARRFSATWQAGSNDADATITTAGERPAVDIRTIKQRGAGKSELHLRFDKVATRLMERLQAACDETVPGGMIALVTVTAPIRLAAKTAAALEDKIRLLGRGSPGRNVKDTIHGNRVRIRLLKNQSERAPKMIGFVHNPDTDPLLLFNLTGELLEISAEAGRRARKRAGGRWLVLISAGGVSCLAACRAICRQLRTATGYKRIFMMFGDGRVERLL